MGKDLPALSVAAFYTQQYWWKRTVKMGKYMFFSNFQCLGTQTLWKLQTPQLY